MFSYPNTTRTHRVLVYRCKEPTQVEGSGADVDRPTDRPLRLLSLSLLQSVCSILFAPPHTLARSWSRGKGGFLLGESRPTFRPALHPFRRSCCARGGPRVSMCTVHHAEADHAVIHKHLQIAEVRSHPSLSREEKIQRRKKKKIKVAMLSSTDQSGLGSIPKQFPSTL